MGGRYVYMAVACMHASIGRMEGRKFVIKMMLAFPCRSVASSTPSGFVWSAFAPTWPSFPRRFSRFAYSQAAFCVDCFLLFDLYVRTGGAKVNGSRQLVNGSQPKKGRALPDWVV